MDLLEKQLREMALWAPENGSEADYTHDLDWYCRCANFAEAALKASTRFVPVELRELLSRISGGPPFGRQEVEDALDLLTEVRGNKPWKKVGQTLSGVGLDIMKGTYGKP